MFQYFPLLKALWFFIWTPTSKGRLRILSSNNSSPINDIKDLLSAKKSMDKVLVATFFISKTNIILLTILMNTNFIRKNKTIISSIISMFINLWFLVENK